MVSNANHYIAFSFSFSGHTCQATVMQTLIMTKADWITTNPLESDV